MRKISERVGMIGFNNFGSRMVVVTYNRHNDIIVKFEQGNTVHTTWIQFQKGEISNPYDKTVYGVGFVGEGNYRASANGVLTARYKTWSNMLERCYVKKIQEKFPTYKGCTVIKAWHNFQNFATWYDENFYEVDGEIMCLDKDILVKGNKIYSPDTCVFVPQPINKLLIKRKSMRGEFPIGVSFHKRSKKYRAQCQGITIKSHDTPEEAFNTYKTFKENYIKEIANEYKDNIPNKLYSALLDYQVEITD